MSMCSTLSLVFLNLGLFTFQTPPWEQLNP